MSDRKSKRFKRQAGCGSKGALRRARGQNQHNGKKSSAGGPPGQARGRRGHVGGAFRRVRKEGE